MVVPIFKMLYAVYDVLFHCHNRIIGSCAEVLVCDVRGTILLVFSQQQIGFDRVKSAWEIHQCAWVYVHCPSAEKPCASVHLNHTSRARCHGLYLATYEAHQTLNVIIIVVHRRQFKSPPVY